MSSGAMSKHRGRRRKIDASTSLADDDEAEFEDGGWECTVCTFRNKSESFKCEVCDVRKGTSTRKPRLNSTVVEQQQSVQKFMQQQQHAMMSQAHREKSRGANDRTSTCSAASTRDADSPSSMSAASHRSVESPTTTSLMTSPSHDFSIGTVTSSTSSSIASISMKNVTSPIIGKNFVKQDGNPSPIAAKPAMSKESSQQNLTTAAKRSRTSNSTAYDNFPPALLPASMISPSDETSATASSVSRLDDTNPSSPINRQPDDFLQPTLSSSSDENDPPHDGSGSADSSKSSMAPTSAGPNGSAGLTQPLDRTPSTRGRKKGSVNGVRRKPPKTFFRKHVDQTSARTLSITVNGLTVVITDYKLLGNADSINGAPDESNLENTIESLIRREDDVTTNHQHAENSKI